MTWWAQSRLRTKIFLAFAAVMLLSLLLTLWLTQLVVSRQIQATLRAEMLTTGQVFQGLVSERAARLLTNTTLLVTDFALKSAIATIKDPSTLTSAALNYQQRIAVDLLWMTDATGTLLADVLGAHEKGETVAGLSPLAEALVSEEAAAAIAERDGALFQLVAVPVFAPDVIGFLVLGDGIDDPLAHQLMQDTGSQISFLTRARVFASSWPPTERNPLLLSSNPDIAQALQHPRIQRQDEIGFLARSFNEMTGGLEDREKIRDVMNKVVSPEIARELLQRGVALGGEVRTVSVLFADIRGFTSLSEKLPPSELVGLLNTYLGRMSRVIEQEKGVVDKYIGDEVMAIFGTPLLLPDHAVRAVTAALQMLEELKDFNATEGHATPLRIGIGIASGPVIAGNVGSPERLNYTVLGDTVNIASRLQGLTKEYGVPLILSGTTSEQVQDVFSCRLLGTVAVRGRQQETTLYTVERKQV